MFAKRTRIVVGLLSVSLIAALGPANPAWARGGRGGGGGGGNRGGYSGGNYNAGASHAYNGGYSAGYRGAATGGAVAGGGRFNSNSGFASRHFAANNNLAAGGAANRFGGAMGPYGMGYGGLGYSGLGGGLGYGMGYPFFGMYGMMGMGGMGMGMGGMGMGGYGGGGGGYGGGGYGSGGYASNSTTGAPTTAATQPAAAAPTADQVALADQFDAKGESDFKAGNYPAAIQDWQHALVDTPHNGGDMLLLAQSLFALGQYQPAAGAVQLGMQMLPQEQWGTVLKHYSDLYPNNQAFTDQLRALETARKANPEDPATRFLLGYEYGYLGYPKQAVAELDKLIDLRPKDRGAVIMRNQFASQAGVPEVPVPPADTGSAPTTPAGSGPAPAQRPSSG